MNALVLDRVAAVPAVPADTPDADLIRLCTEYVALARETNRLMELAGDQIGGPKREIERQIETLILRTHEVRDTITSLRAQTPEGLQAKAIFVVWHVSGDPDSAAELEPGCSDLLMSEHAPAYSLALDVAGRGQAAAQRLVSLPAACSSSLCDIADELEELQRRIELFEKQDDVTFDDDESPAAHALVGWWLLAKRSADMPVVNPADLHALARISQATWKRTTGDECDLRDQIDQKLAAAVVAIAQPSPLADAAKEIHLIETCRRLQQAELRVQDILSSADNTVEAEDTAEAEAQPFSAVVSDAFKALEGTRPRTIEGCRAMAAAAAAWRKDMPTRDRMSRDQKLIESLLEALTSGDV